MGNAVWEAMAIKRRQLMIYPDPGGKAVTHRDRKLPEAGYCDCAIDLCDLHTEEQAQEREAFEAMREALISMLNLEMASLISERSIEVCKGLDTRYHTEKARAALALADKVR
jgi:hypothetical protein